MRAEQWEWRAKLRDFLAELPKEYSAARREAAAISHAFHQELAAAIGPRLNEHLKTLRQESYEEKRTLAAWCNQELRSMHLCIRCPRTGREGILLADIVGGQYDAPRFRIQTKDERGRVARTYASRELPSFELMEAAPRQEGQSRWRRHGGEEPRER